MAFYLRYTETPELDLERNSSLHFSDLDESFSVEEVAESFGCDVDDVVLVNGVYCQKLNGLCGFEINADSLEEAIEEVESHNYNHVYNFSSMGYMAVLFEGNYNSDCPEGDLFSAKNILHKF